MVNLYIQDILNTYELEKNTETFNKRIVIVDRKTEYRSLAKTWQHENENDNSLYSSLVLSNTNKNKRKVRILWCIKIGLGVSGLWPFFP